MEEVKSVKYLGVTVTDYVAWNKPHRSTATSIPEKRIVKVKSKDLKQKLTMHLSAPLWSIVWDPHTVASIICHQ
jgi:hypothetical protein